MNKLTSMKKIISVALLCFTFLTLFPSELFALVTTVPDTRKETGVIKVGTAQVNWLNTVLAVGTLGNTSNTFPPVQAGALNIKLDTLPGGKGAITDNYYTALNIAAKGGYTGTEQWINPDTQKPYEKDNIYVLSSNGGVSYYYKPNGATDAERNENTVLIAHASGGEIYFPDRTDSNGRRINYISKLSANNTQEKTLYDNIDREKGRPVGETYNNLIAVDQLQQNKEGLNVAQKNLETLQQQLQADNAARQRNDGTALTDEKRKVLERDIASASTVVQQQKERVDRGVQQSSGPSTIGLTGCPSTLQAVTSPLASFLLNPTCIVSVLAIGANIVLKLSAYILYLAGNLFDYSIEIAVNSAQFIRGLAIVDPTWAAIRDFLNMTFIFILIYISWQILLGKAGYNVKTSVGRLVLVAVLINFSLFGAKLMVDGSNIISLNIYEGIKAKEAGTTESSRGSVSARVMTALGMTSVYKFEDAFDNKTVPGCGDVPSTILTVGIFGTILMVIITITFLLPALLFFLRMLNILALLITSPLLVYGYVIPHPKLKEMSDKWFSNMMHVVKFPILYMLMLYVSLAMFAQLVSTNVGNKLSVISILCQTIKTDGTSTSDVIFSQIPLILNFILVIAAMLSILKWSVGEVSKASLTGKLATKIAGGFDGFSRKITIGAAQGVYNKSAAVAGFAGRNALALAKAPISIAKDKVQLHALNMKKDIANSLGGMAAKNNANPLTQALFASMSTKVKNAKVFGESEDEAAKRRVSGAAKTQAMVSAVVADQLKIETNKEKWMKDNPNGDYDKYIEDKIRLIEDNYLGELKDGSAQKDKNGNLIKNSDHLRDEAYDTTYDAQGKAVKKFNQTKLNKALLRIREAHTKDGTLVKQEKRFEAFAEEKAKARIKEEDKKLKENIIGKQKTIDDKKKQIEKTRELIDRLPEDVHKASQETDLSKYDSRVTAYKNETDPVKKDKLREDISEKREALENKIEKLMKDIETMEEKASNKK